MGTSDDQIIVEGLCSDIQQAMAKALGAITEVREKMEILSRYATSKATGDDQLRDLIKHCWIHSGYQNCGYNQMTTEQKALFDTVTASRDEVD